MKSNIVEQVLTALRVEGSCTGYAKTIGIISDAIIYPQKYTHDNMIAVVPLETGGGKSSITNISLAWLVNNDLSAAGTIVLKERIADCEDAVKQINQLCGKKVAAPYHSNLFMINGKYSHKYEIMYRRSLIKYPILIMTHQGFVRRHQRLGDYVQWTTEEDAYDLSMVSKIRSRTRLIVDEHPATLKLTQINNDSLNLIESFAQGTANRELFTPIFEICAYIRSHCFIKPADLHNQYWVRCGIKTTDKLDKYFYDRRTADEILDIYTALKILCTNGGFVNYCDDSNFLNVTVGKHVDIFDEIFNPIILDGTAKINNLYKHKRFNMVELPKIKTYNNTTINICKQLNGSKNELENHTEIISAALQYIEINKPPNEDGLIITLKEYEQDFISIGLPPRTVIDHFGNITGTNKYINCKYLYIVGVRYLPDNAYKIAYHTYSEDLDMNKEQKTITVNGVRKLIDQDYRETSASMVAAELVQAINRVRCRKWEKGDTLETCIFMLNKDPDVINLIQQCMEGVKITYDFEFFDNLPKHIQEKKPAQAIDVVLSIISNHGSLFTSNKVEKKKIFDMHDMTSRLSGKTKSVIWKHPAIQQLESDGRIKVHTRHIEFLK